MRTDLNQPKKPDMIGSFDLSDTHSLIRIINGAAEMELRLIKSGKDVNYVYCERARDLAKAAQNILDLYSGRGHVGLEGKAPKNAPKEEN